MTTPPAPRRHRRAAGQLLMGLVPVLVVGVAALVLLLLRLPDAQAPLAAATSTAPSTVTATGGSPDGRALTVTFRDADDDVRTGRLLLNRRLDVPPGTHVTVRYDPDAAGADPVPVYIDGDAAHSRVSDLVFGLVAVAVVLVVVTALTAARLLTRPRLRRRVPTRVAATHVVSRQGLLVRSWLEMGTPAGLRWVPVHWAPELDRLTPDSLLEVRGDPARDRLVLPVVDGSEVWPSGRMRTRVPRGDVRQAAVDPDALDPGLGRQARADGVVPFLAPVLGLLWAYVDGSGAGGFLLATALSAAVLFWLPQLLGSDPRPTRA
ncbi:hypothetical protein SAMN05661080_01493 [Modestobacter sp. DSM 44400]|uniref:DUF3592 domain-containing protein n=1 Tax=Modestobacter sp. DSM 44400 TaxID=1550230 RepID=UPI0008988AED|nr:DUF3592 domain-containing protein [Modestobacter sp. DSM 44400]SDX86646.1 hypothetical protein SAMN05661080_01493 [Modestobacter sp. DSM 44400]